MWRILGNLTTVALLCCGYPTKGSDFTSISAAIDREIQKQLDTEQLSPVATAGDAEFLRRVYLDLHGVVPTAAQTIQFSMTRVRTSVRD